MSFQINCCWGAFRYGPYIMYVEICCLGPVSAFPVPTNSSRQMPFPSKVGLLVFFGTWIERMVELLERQLWGELVSGLRRVKDSPRACQSSPTILHGDWQESLCHFYICQLRSLVAVNRIYSQVSVDRIEALMPHLFLGALVSKGGMIVKQRLQRKVQENNCNNAWEILLYVIVELSIELNTIF